MCIGVGSLKEPSDKGLGCEQGMFVRVYGECLNGVSLKKCWSESGHYRALIFRDMDTSRGRGRVAIVLAM